MKKALLLLAFTVFLTPLWAQESPFAPAQIEKVLQMVVDLPNLHAYLHPELKGRVPLVVVNEALGKDFKLTKFDQPVQILSKNEAQNRPCLEITTFLIQGEKVTVDFTYAVEGVVGNILFVWRDNSWQVETCKVERQKK